jgi:hypothetical protein
MYHMLDAYLNRIVLKKSSRPVRPTGYVYDFPTSWLSPTFDESNLVELMRNGEEVQGKREKGRERLPVVFYCCVPH